jgi:hypothetical protein
MTANWPASVVWVLVLAFFVVVAIGIAMGAYAANNLKKREGEEKPVA